ncbi:FlgT C-terminal domain-containing protein [Modestobacter italicus]|uniref:FlgT C-terminal domain-containing protein n=1 Tax=Modestobacter italicus (strain DSM 44449 / CECT 9708 / BC 501) TaxID=2732864 RepID=UPI001C9794F0|nr:FlgT C-terminal domain-containing protein [Modestobacter italicus]
MVELSARVAAVLDEFRIAIAAGEDEGVEVGDRVDLWRVVDIRDPETKEHLGRTRLEKLRLEIEDVQDRFSVARVYSPAFNFTNVMFSSRPEKSIKTRGAPRGDVEVEIGEEATIYLDGVDDASEDPADSEESGRGAAGR